MVETHKRKRKNTVITKITFPVVNGKATAFLINSCRQLHLLSANYQTTETGQPHK